MQKAKPLKDSAEGVEEYLARVPEPAQSTLRTVRATIKAAVPKDATEGISYGMPAFRHNGALVAYGAFKNHCSFFPMQASLIDAMQEDLKGYRTAKGTLQFALDKPLPAALVKKMVKARVIENKAREATKAARAAAKKARAAR
jgi:uncharacterized protein YdhG (YjbR/CyaY superfamily)